MLICTTFFVCKYSSFILHTIMCIKKIYAQNILSIDSVILLKSIHKSRSSYYQTNTAIYRNNSVICLVLFNVVQAVEFFG